MSKYITHFQTEAAYQSALPTLDLPNVSLVDELGEVHYHRALYGAHAGDIALYDVAEGQKIFVTAADWNLTSYPTASYPIIGIAVADESALGLTLVATHSFNADGTKNLSEKTQLKWQNIYIDWGIPVKTTADEAKADFNGKSNTATILAAIKAYDLSHSTDNITGNIGQGIQLYSTEGTVAGDWYMPASGELYTLYQNQTAVTATVDKLRAADTTLAVTPFYRYNYHSSSSKSPAKGVWLVDTGIGNVGRYDSTEIAYTRAFLHLN